MGIMILHKKKISQHGDLGNLSNVLTLLDQVVSSDSQANQTISDKHSLTQRHKLRPPPWHRRTNHKKHDEKNYFEPYAPPHMEHVASLMPSWEGGQFETLPTTPHPGRGYPASGSLGAHSVQKSAPPQHPDVRSVKKTIKWKHLIKVRLHALGGVGLKRGGKAGSRDVSGFGVSAGLRLGLGLRFTLPGGREGSLENIIIIRISLLPRGIGCHTKSKRRPTSNAADPKRTKREGN